MKIEEIIEDEEKFTRTIPLRDENVNLENVKITAKPGALTVDVRRDEKHPDGSWSSDGSKTQFSLPLNVDTDKLVSMVTPQGELKMEAPLLPSGSQATVYDSSSLPHNKWTIDVPVPEEIDPDRSKVTIEGNIISIQATILKWPDDGTASPIGVQEFTSKITLPERVNLNKLSSTWTNKGILKIEAPFK